MDLSKIPNSQGSADRPANPQPRPVEPIPPDAPSPQQQSNHWLEGPEAFFVGAIGLIVCWYVSRFFSFVLHATTGSSFTYTFTDVDGSPLAYTASWFFIADVSGALAGLAMIFEAIALGIIRRKSAAWAVVGVMALATVANIFAFLYLLPKFGGQLLQLICALICAYAAWSLYNRLRA